MKQRLKRWIFRLLGKDPEAVVVAFCTGDRDLCSRMVEEVRGLTPDRRHISVWENGKFSLEFHEPGPGAPHYETFAKWRDAKRRLKRYRIGLAPVMLGPAPNHLRRAAYWLAPRKILAYNSRLERHHLRPNLASFLFWRGAPLDRIYLRPWWWPWPKRERTIAPSGYRVLEGRACSPERRRVALLSPYFPYPLSHGGAVRIFHLLREIAREFDVELFAFTDTETEPDMAPVLEVCARVVLAKKPRYREPRWSTLLPPEAHEFRSSAMSEAIARERGEFGFELLQVEYTQLARYGRDVLVEHDVTFDLFEQIARRNRTLASWWDAARWRRMEKHSVARYRRVVVMSQKDAKLLGPQARTAVIENGVDLDRFCPAPEQPGERALFIGSFRHLPNVEAYRFFTEQVWPLLREGLPRMTLTAVCGPDYLTYWRMFADTREPKADERIRLFGFVADVRPLYAESNLVIVPTTVSAGTNLKVLEAMAMERAVVSTSSGCAGLGLSDGQSVWIADTPEQFACGVATLISHPERRKSMAFAARALAAQRYDWQGIGKKQRELLRSLLEEQAAKRDSLRQV
jgi:polysaccharide biosynthesis protein PslH